MGIMAALNESIGFTTTIKSFNGSNKISDLSKSEKEIAYQISLFIGPAFTFTINDTVRLSVAPGVSILLGELLSYNNLDYYNNRKSYFAEFTGVGPGITLQAKFLPKNKVSPVAGYRFAANFSKVMKTGEFRNFETVEPKESKQDSIVVFTNVIYAGISINW